MFPIYTKTFGGKIWNNLHSVSPDNFRDKKFKMASLVIFREKLFQHHLVQKNSPKNANSCSPLKTYPKSFLTSLLV